MNRVVVIFLAVMLVVAPLMPQRATASSIVLCADGVVKVVQVDANGQPLTPCPPNGHCILCLGAPAVTLPTSAMVARPVSRAFMLDAASLLVPRPWSVRIALNARGPPQQES